MKNENCMWCNNIKMTEKEIDDIKELRKCGCTCNLPLLGYIPSQGPRCRMCGVESYRDVGIKE